jgi:serine/threonine protein kinase
MLTGRTPFHSDTPVGYLRKHLMEEPPPFRSVKPGLPVPPRIESIVMKALTKDRNLRYGSVLEFAQEFAQAAGTQVAARPETRRVIPNRQSGTTITPMPKASVPNALWGTVAAKAVPDVGHRSQRKWLSSRWRRIGIVASVVWILGAGIYTLKVTNDDTLRRASHWESICLDTLKGQDPEDKCGKEFTANIAEEFPIRGVINKRGSMSSMHNFYEASVHVYAQLFMTLCIVIEYLQQLSHSFLYL